MHSDLSPLEFSGIQRLLEKLSATPYGAEAARNIEPAPDAAIARRMQRAVSAARGLIERGAAPRLHVVPDIRAALRQAAQSGAALAASALNHIRGVVNIARELQVTAQQTQDLYPGAHTHLAPPATLLADIDRVLQANGGIRPDASVRLQELNIEAQAARAAATAVLEQRLHAAEGATNAERIRWQGHRGMLALAPAFAEKVKGVRRANPHDHDILVEPLEAVALNNRLEAIAGQQDHEHQQLRRALTDVVRAETAALRRMLDAITWIDLALAGGHLSVHLNATEPQLVDDATITLDRAYHPTMLLQFAERRGPQPVPLTITLDAQQPMLVITGPNTGGKTVVLKTIGVLATMAYCGLHIPAEGPCVIGSFNRVIVGIGDAQSLSHHLSTFAGHVEVLKRLVNEADAGTLVLIDELGTGTDPEEGAALAMAVLDELAQREVRGVVTTHLPPLKAYAQTHPRLRNASMRFDAAALQPTYELDVGVSGRSLGLVIAGRNGLAPDLLKRAREHLRRIAPYRDDV